jgi:hypothetical protein
MMSSTRVGNCTACRVMVHEPIPATIESTENVIKEGKCAKPRADQYIAWCHVCQVFRVFSIWRTTYESAI